MLPYQTPRKPDKKTRTRFSLAFGLTICMSSIFLIGTYLCFSFLSHNSVKSNYSVNERFELKGVSLYETKEASTTSFQEGTPDWTLEHWTPVEIFNIHFRDGKPQAKLKMCQLNFEKYTATPHLTPMFKDVVQMSNCNFNSKSEDLSTLVEKARTGEVRVVEPNGFVFHESRVGSTLVANMIASDPWNMVFSESDPPATALTHCPGCTDDESVALFRDVITVMGISPVHKHLFFKFQSITTTRMHIALRAFPNTPWAFIFRQSVQTMMSQMAPLKGSAGGPCLRSKSHPPGEVSSAIAEYTSTSQAPDEAWCAAHLKMLCQNAINAFKLYGKKQSPGTDNDIQKGALVDYEGLPAAVPKIILPLFGTDVSPKWLIRMEEESNFYSKARKKDRTFEGDSEDKEKRATDEIKLWANRLLDPIYREMSEIAVEAASNVVPNEVNQLPPADIIDTEGAVLVKDGKKLWSSLEFSNAIVHKKAFTGSYTLRKLVKKASTSKSDVEGNALSRHSLFEEEGAIDVDEQFMPWAPFASSHRSEAVEHVKCPKFPPQGYPKHYPIMDVIGNWNPDDTTIPVKHYDSLCHFDLSDPVDYAKAENYRKAEVPFIGYNYDLLDSVVMKWGDLKYLRNKIGSQTFRTETSKDNHFMYWTNGRRVSKDKKWKPPTDSVSMTFDEWLKGAVLNQNITLGERDHKYFRVTADDGHKMSKNSWIFDELEFFQPKKSLFMVNPEYQQGIHCRFGMRSIIAEAHFDRSRNSIAMLRGMRRWIMTHPANCDHMYILPKDHPSGRHSEVDWSQPDLDAYPDFPKTKVHEAILQPGDILYIPTNWIHYIVSLNINIQCNTRSGSTHEYDKDTRMCGF